MGETGIFLLIIGLELIPFSAFIFPTNDKLVGTGKVEINTNNHHHSPESLLIKIPVIRIGGADLWKSLNKNEIV